MKLAEPWTLLVLFLLLPRPANGQNSAPVVMNVQAQQLPGTGLVQITYDVQDADGDLIVARVICSSDGGTTFDLFATTISGDGADGPVAPGPGKVLTWDAATDYPGRYWANVVAKVVVSDGAAGGGEMVLVPAGDFVMGDTDAGPGQVVYLDDFQIDRYEVTVGQYQAFVDAGGYEAQAFWSDPGWDWRVANQITEPTGWTGQLSYVGFPVSGVSYYEAEAYANFIGKRLPTEPEWEKAARGTEGGVGWKWAVGQVIDATRVNYRDSGDPFEVNGAGLTPVGFYDGRSYPNPPYEPFQTTNAPSPYGTYDQCGNAYEWVDQWYGSTARVIRGGSHATNLTFNGVPGVRFTTWNVQADGPASQGYGFRCAKNSP
jgi:formylglycine-generating enzyme required for sulfatase activity